MTISVTYLKRNHSLVIGRKTAKQLKEHIGSARMPQQEQTMKVVGRDIVSGLPIEMEISSSMIYEAIKDDLNSLCTSIRLILEKVPPELAKGYCIFRHLSHWRKFQNHRSGGSVHRSDKYFC